MRQMRTEIWSLPPDAQVLIQWPSRQLTRAELDDLKEVFALLVRREERSLAERDQVNDSKPEGD